MKTTLSSFLLICSFLLISCTGSRELNDATSESDRNNEAETSTTVSAVEASKDWYRTSANNDPYIGTGVEKAYQDLLDPQGKRKEIVVAIIDSGTDIYHEDLKANVWVNSDEIAGNNIDDDNNGYVDDIHGWNFIGGPDSTHVSKDTYEFTRLYARLHPEFQGKTREEIDTSRLEDYELYLEVKKTFENRREQNEQELNNLTQIMAAIGNAKKILGVTNIDSLDQTDLELKTDESAFQQQAKQIISTIKSNGATESDLEDTQEYLDYLQGLKDFGLNPDFNPRRIVGDDYDDLTDRYYGNNDVTGPDNSHGTHVAGIVGAVRSNNLGIKGISDVKLMIIRTVPDGDERDKDVANAIRYAAENGAHVINMSFGKGYSPNKAYVDDAVRYADSVGVLMITGSGNDGNNIDSTDSYPSKYYKNGGMATNFINVGASSWEADSTLAATFSNYGKEKVDIFAPGVEIYSTYPDDTYKMENGTSMAAPVVAGISALIMQYYPELSATQVKQIILNTVTSTDRLTYIPGSDEKAPFSSLSVSGGIINAYEALKSAKTYSQKN